MAKRSEFVDGIKLNKGLQFNPFSFNTIYTKGYYHIEFLMNNINDVDSSIKEVIEHIIDVNTVGIISKKWELKEIPEFKYSCLLINGEGSNDLANILRPIIDLCYELYLNYNIRGYSHYSFIQEMRLHDMDIFVDGNRVGPVRDFAEAFITGSSNVDSGFIYLTIKLNRKKDLRFCKRHLLWLLYYHCKRDRLKQLKENYRNRRKGFGYPLSYYHGEHGYFLQKQVSTYSFIEDDIKKEYLIKVSIDISKILSSRNPKEYENKDVTGLRIAYAYLKEKLDIVLKDMLAVDYVIDKEMFDTIYKCYVDTDICLLI